jgi:hypothetical protein
LINASGLITGKRNLKEWLPSYKYQQLSKTLDFMLLYFTFLFKPDIYKKEKYDKLQNARGIKKKVS